MIHNSAFTRRRFLRQTSIALGGIYGAASRDIQATAAADKRTPPSERITVGMIGMGRQTKNRNLPQFLSMPDVQIVAICDVDSWRLEQAKRTIEQQYAKDRSAGQYKGCETYVDFNDLLARKDIDAVMISTPDHWHVPMALAAFKAGKDVSLEKPITRSIAEGRALTRLAAGTRRIFRVDSELRSYPHIVKAAELVRNGRIGKVQKVTVGVPFEGADVICPAQPEMPVPKELDYARWQGDAPKAPYTLKRVHKPKSYERPGWMRHLYYCDGMITNWTTHWNDGAMFMTGLEQTGPVEVEGQGQYPPKDNFWNVLMSFEVRMRFANGVDWMYHCDKPYLRIEGTEGWISATYEKLDAHPLSILDSKIGPSALRFAVKSDKQDFIDCVKSRKETLEPAEVGHRVTSLGHLGHIAIQLGQRLKWDPDKEQFQDNDEANRLLQKPIHEPRYV